MSLNKKFIYLDIQTWIHLFVEKNRILFRWEDVLFEIKFY